MNYDKYLKIVFEAIEEVTPIFYEGYSKATEFELKSADEGFVTFYDKEIEKVLISNLNREEKFSIIAEESGIYDTKSEFSWVIDPIDGTTNFIRSIPICCISISLMHQDVPILGVTSLPILKENYYAYQGGGAFLNGEKIKVSTQESLESSVIGFSLGNLQRHNSFIKIIELLGQNSHQRGLGSVAIEMCYVASGKVDAYIAPNDRIWDYAAGSVILKEAGGKFSDWSGEETYTSPNKILASNSRLYNELISAINGIIDLY